MLHIFWKDARRFWPEILVSLVILAAFVRVYPVNWLPQDGFHSRGFFQYASQMQVLANVLTSLVPVSWWLLIARVIHAEALVGERQFWVTRPYAWPWLLAAKGLFLAVFLYLPFLVAQWVLLWEGGFRPERYVAGLLFELLLMTGVVVPLVALAAVTSTLVRMTLTILGIAAAFAGIAFLGSLVESSSVSTPYGDRYTLPAIVVIGGGAIVVMYARRKVWFARMLLLSLPAILAVVLTFFPNGSMVETAYPLEKGMAAAADVPIQFQFRTDLGRVVRVTGDSRTKNVEVQIPLEAGDVGAGRVVMVDDAMATAVEANGKIHVVPWVSVYNHYFLHGDWVTSVDLKMARTDYEALKGKVVTLKLSLALTEAKSEAVTRIALPGHDFEVPGFGRCAGASGPGATLTGLGCWTALHGPPLTLVKANLGGTPCGEKAGASAVSDAGPDGDGVEHATAWEGSLENDPADFGLTSVWSKGVSLATGESYGSRYLCPGTMVSFTRFGLVRRLRTVVAIPNFRLPEMTKDLRSDAGTVTADSLWD